MKIYSFSNIFYLNFVTLVLFQSGFQFFKIKNPLCLMSNMWHSCSSWWFELSSAEISPPDALVTTKYYDVLDDSISANVSTIKNPMNYHITICYSDVRLLNKTVYMPGKTRKQLKPIKIKSKNRKVRNTGS